MEGEQLCKLLYYSSSQAHARLHVTSRRSSPPADPLPPPGSAAVSNRDQGTDQVVVQFTSVLLPAGGALASARASRVSR